MRVRIVAAFLACAAIGIIVVGRTTGAPTPAQKCLASKLKEIGKYDSCRLKAEAKAVTQGGAPSFSNCSTRLSSRWTAIEQRGGCTFPGDQAAPQAETEAHTDLIVELLTNGAPPVCGDATVNGSEECDGADLAGESCSSLGYAGGPLACSGACLFDTSGCLAPASCGNATLEVGEQCDGVELNGFGCADFGFSFGVGTLACNGACDLDTSGCVQLCGNGSINGSESCDGVDLGGATCASYGGSGTLACDAECDLDFAGCAFTCGNGSAEPGEECDGADLSFESCGSFDFAGGTLACTGGCQYDTSGCTATCGDNIVSEGAGEQCDGTSSSPNCTDLFYTSGALTCTGACTYDTSACLLECDYLDQDCPSGEGCYLAVGGGGGCASAGAGGALDACTVQNDCQARHVCLPLGDTLDVCLPFCDSLIGDADCPAGYTCLDVPIQADPDLGVCVPF